MKSQITIHCFVYSGDADVIEETVRCAQQALPEARLVIIDDFNNPCPQEVQEKIKKRGCEWRSSKWARRGNLRGKECIVGILSELLSSTHDDNDILIKMDADTCLMNGDDIRCFAQDSSKVLCAAGELDVRVYGYCYCIRGYALKKVLNYINSLEIPAIAAEDVVIGFSLCQLYPDPAFHTLYKTDVKASKWTAYHWWYYPDTQYYNGASVITVGNKAPAPLSKKQRLSVMRNLRHQAALFLKEKV